MSCYKPMHMAVIKFKDGKEAWHFKAQHNDKSNWKINLETLRGYLLVSKNSREVDIEKALANYSYEIIETPCHNCIGCRLDYSKDWANRATLEASAYDYNWFISLTYDDDHLVKGKLDNATLVPEHFTKFIHDLRNHFRDNYDHIGIKFLGCGEYGDVSARPHIHLILFNLPLPDLTTNFKDKDGYITQHFDSRGVPYMYSQTIKDLWPYGNILIADCNWNTSAYVSQYVLKKQKGKDAQLYKRLDIVPPFLRMSNGIGKAYYDEHKEKLAEFPQLFIPREHLKPITSNIPRAFRKYLLQDGLIDFEQSYNQAQATAEAGRSLLKGKQKINTHRSIKEANKISMQSVKERVAN